jgi:hypothetical protein
MPHTHLRLNTNIIRNRSGQSLEVRKKQRFFGVRETLDRKYLIVRLHTRTRGLNLAADIRVTVKLLSCRNIRMWYKLNKARYNQHYKAWTDRGRVYIVCTVHWKYYFIFSVFSKCTYLSMNFTKTKEYRTYPSPPSENAPSPSRLRWSASRYTRKIRLWVADTLTNENPFREETKGRLQSGNACYHSV